MYNSPLWPFISKSAIFVPSEYAGMIDTSTVILLPFASMIRILLLLIVNI